MVAAWGKTDRREYHHLAHHCADVAACLEILLAIPVICSRLETAAGRKLGPVDMARLAVVTFLHDTGKLHPGFQAKGWPQDQWTGSRHGHVAEGLAAFLSDDIRISRIGDALHLDILAEWGVCEGLLRASIGHHGKPFEIGPANERRWDIRCANGYDAFVSAREIGALLPLWFPLAFTPGGELLPDNPAFQHLFCGLATLADWLGSNRAIFTFVGHLNRSYMDDIARPAARRAVAGVGLDCGPWRSSMADAADFSFLAPGFSPRAAQQVVGGWPVDDQLLILEAETGAGKTEAALWRFAQLFAAGRVDGLYFALPTRAAARQIHSRVTKVMARLFGANGPEPVLAVPGYLLAGGVSARALPDFKLRWDDNPDEAQLLSRWAAENAKRYLAAAVAVGTVDQAMLGALQVKHAHLRAASLARSLLVIDEVHASDRYLTRIGQALVQAQVERGGHVMLMSATLGSAARTGWRRGPQVSRLSLEAAIGIPYPAVWGRGANVAHSVGTDRRTKSVRMTVADGWDAATAARHAIAAAKAGAKVLVIRNTVTAALASMDAIIASGGESLLWQVAGGPALHHSRFAPEDRELLDRAVEAALSPDLAKRPAGGMIIIGSQTLEQSLDIDADFLITDLCPADVLLQRIGRLHRHDLPRPPGFEEPQCLILSPADGLDALARPMFDNGLGMFGAQKPEGIYTNLHSCELTRRLALAHPQWRIPDMNRLLVESATHDDAIEALNAEKEGAWRRYWQIYSGNEIAMGQAGRRVTLQLDKPLDDSQALFLSDEEAVRTRLGSEGVRLNLCEGVIGPFGQPISSFTLPGHWRPQSAVPEEALRPDQPANGDLFVGVGGMALRYSQRGLERPAGLALSDRGSI